MRVMFANSMFLVQAQMWSEFDFSSVEIISFHLLFTIAQFSSPRRP